MDLFKLSTTHRLTISSFESLLFTLQIFNLDARANVKSHIMPEPWVRWKWTSVSNLGDVTATSLYHWPLEDANPPVRVFNWHSTLGLNCQIIKYKVSPDMKWCILGGISV